MNNCDIFAIKSLFDDISDIFGIDFNKKETSSSNKELLDIIADIRSNLRKEKQYELYDKIRDDLVELGYKISD